MIHRLRAAHLTTYNVVVAFLVLNFIFLSAVTGLVLYGMQINDQRHADTEKLEATIAQSDRAATNNTDRLVKQTIAASDRNYITLQARGNVTNGIFANILDKLEQGSHDLKSQHEALLHSLAPDGKIIARQIKTSQEVHDIKNMLGNLTQR